MDSKTSFHKYLALSRDELLEVWRLDTSIGAIPQTVFGLSFSVFFSVKKFHFLLTEVECQLHMSDEPFYVNFWTNYLEKQTALESSVLLVAKMYVCSNCLYRFGLTFLFYLLGLQKY